ncbi:MAG: NUDIX domain-containing protein [Oscillospiraceae bacterium]|nr:NUDIX domain-containing protein [Oscillospiraceae bacterium]
MEARTVTTLCYLERDGRYLMLHRTKKENDINRDKYIGVGGHLEHGESPEDCIRREIEEETGLRGGLLRLRGLLTFVIDDMDELSFLYTGSGFSGKLRDCDEGELVWIGRGAVGSLPLWEGDRLFFRLLEEDRPFFSLKLVYVHDRLISAALDGEPLPLTAE